MTRGRDRLRIGVLGPIRVHDADRDLTPDGVLQRRLLALLVLRRGRVVSVDGAIEAVWPVRVPKDPVPALQNHVFRLRRGLPAGLIESVGEGYRLGPARVELDADVLAEAVTAAEPGAGVLAVIDPLLEGWSGPAYPELAELDEARIEAARLDELRARAIEVRAACRLAMGDADKAIVELAALAGDEPLREQPRALLMTALARTGRRVEALRVYDDFRRLLGAELGIEPSPQLTAQQVELLSGAGGAGAAGAGTRPPAGDWAPASRLPSPPASLIGRDALVEEVTSDVRTHRLVTLVGPGGVGKTRLSVEIGHRLMDANGTMPVVVAELSTADEHSAVDIVAAALAVEPRPGVRLDERITTVIADRAVVLILDNCEHVLDPVAGLAERLIATCPNVRLLATSRERLRVHGERVRSVPVLAWDGDDGPAVQLFVERARAVAPQLALDAGTQRQIAEIVRRLDGLPLAIELAAAQLHTHDVAEVAAGLDHRFSLLSSGYRASARHGSLGATVSWSYDQLDERLRRVFADLSVYNGSFTAEDAAAVCGGDTVAVRTALAQLAERSLVMRTSGRYVLLETLRAFGAEQLTATGRAEAARDRHARYQVEWIERADRRMNDDGPDAITGIEAALPELRSALGWLLDRGQVELAGRLVASLRIFGFMRQRPDVLLWAERVVAADPDDRSPVAPLVWVVSAFGVWMAGDVGGAGERGMRALQISERAGRVPAEVSTVCGNHALFTGDLDEAVRWYRRAAETVGDSDRAHRCFIRGTEVLARAYAGDPTAAGIGTELLDEVGDAITPLAAYVSYCAGEADLSADIDRARARLDRAIQLADLTNSSFVSGVAGASKASIDARFGDPLAAAEDYKRLIVQWRRAGVWSAQWTMLRSIAGLLDRLGRHRDAAVLEGAVRATTAGHRIFGTDEAALAELRARLRDALGDEAYEAARREGAALDGDAAAEHALRSL